MSAALEQKVDKILDYLGVMSARNEERFDAIETDLTDLKASTRRLEARQGILESYMQTLVNTQHEHQTQLTEIAIRVERLEDWRRSLN